MGKPEVTNKEQYKGPYIILEEDNNVHENILTNQNYKAKN